MRHRDYSTEVGRAWDGQQGVASIEFALVSGVLLLLLYGLLSVGLLFWMQQKVSHVTGDVARRAVTASMMHHAHPAQAACSSIDQHVANDLLLRQLGPGAITCLASEADQACPDDADARCASVKVVADLAAWPLLTMVQMVYRGVAASDSTGVNDQLSATVMVRVRKDSGS